MVCNESTLAPIAIKVSAPPNPSAAITAKISGRIGKPPFTSGPLAKKAPSNATISPNVCKEEGLSPSRKATVNGITAASEAIGLTTPIRPVASPV